MTAAVAETHVEERLDVAGLAVRYLKGGTGAPVLVLHHSTGNPGWLPFHEALAGHASITVPDMPGWGQSARPEWAREPRDLAVLMHQFCDKADLDRVAVVGLGFGGFVAAEMASMNAKRLSHLVMVGAPGLQPEEGEIMDQMMFDFHEYVAAGLKNPDSMAEHFGDEKGRSFRELWDYSREMTARITWKPYMFSRRLAPLLAEVQTPTLLLYGRDDAVVPPVVASQYKAAFGNAKAELIPGGHLLEYEDPNGIAGRVAAFIAQS